MGHDPESARPDARGTPTNGKSWAVQVGAEKILAAEDMRDYAIFALDAEGRVASWNTGAQRLKGYSSEEIIGRHFSLFYPPDQVESRYPDWELKRASEDGFYIDRGWRVRKDRTQFWAHVVITAQRTPDGALDGFIKVVRNETEANAPRERTARRFADLLELAPTAISLLDDSGQILQANGALCDLLGYRLSELYELHGHDLLHATDVGGDLLSAIPRSTTVQPIPHRVLRRSDGSPVPCQINSAASVRDDGSRSWLVTFHDISEQIQQAEALRHQATHDDLTDLLNSRGFEERVSVLLQSREPGTVGVVMCNINNFKRINDALGHPAGDRLLTAVATRLGTELPDNCELARFYGDEFAIICTDLDGEQDLLELSRYIAKLFRMEVPLNERQVQISASVGASVVAGADTNIGDLLYSAEAALLEDRAARGQGLPNVRSSRRGAVERDQLGLEEDLREAIRNDRIGLHYQPVIDNAGAVILAEALLRWQHPEFGLLTPDHVLEVARAGDLLAELDTCVLRTALHEAVRWQSTQRPPVRVSVNLAGLRPEQPEFVQTVREAIHEAGIEPGCVVLEMVETVLTQLDDDSRHRMLTLVDDGVQFAIDDFGTGYSSLARLKEMPTQIIKMDRKFVAGIGSDPDDLGIARAITELARTLGRFCIAEGVENTTQHLLLHAVAVDAYQGYLFSPPIPPENFRVYLEPHSP